MPLIAVLLLLFVCRGVNGDAYIQKNVQACYNLAMSGTILPSWRDDCIKMLAYSYNNSKYDINECRRKYNASQNEANDYKNKLISTAMMSKCARLRTIYLAGFDNCAAISHEMRTAVGSFDRIANANDQLMAGINKYIKPEDSNCKSVINDYKACNKTLQNKIDTIESVLKYIGDNNMPIDAKLKK